MLGLHFLSALIQSTNNSLILVFKTEIFDIDKVQNPLTLFLAKFYDCINVVVLLFYVDQVNRIDIFFSVFESNNRPIGHIEPPSTVAQRAVLAEMVSVVLS